MPWRSAQNGTVPARSPLDDAEISAHAFARYWRMMRVVAIATTAVIVVVLTGFFWKFGPISIHFYIATGLGIGLSMVLAGALMGLAFLSSGTGHDKAVDNRLPPNQLD